MATKVTTNIRECVKCEIYQGGNHIERRIIIPPYQKIGDWSFEQKLELCRKALNSMFGEPNEHGFTYDLLSISNDDYVDIIHFG